MANRTLPVLAIVAAWALAACSQPPLPEDHFYRLDMGAPARIQAEPSLSGTLEIEPFVADGLTAQRPIVYSDEDRPGEVKAYHYHFWTDPPTVMLRDALVDYLRAAGLAGMVVTPEVRVEPDYVLSGRIKRLERVLGNPSRVVVELELRLRGTADDRLLLLKTYGVKSEAREDNIAAAIDAFNRALIEIYAKFANDVSGI